MIYLKWFVFLIVNLVTNILNYPAVPFVVPFASKDGWLPDWLNWFQTPDNSLDGDLGWQKTHARGHYWNRVRWLWRNKLYGFSRAVLSVRYAPANGDYGTLTGDPDIGNQGQLAKSGTYFKLLYDCKSNIKGFEKYYIRQWKWWPSKCVRILIGWKLPDASDNGKETVCTFGFSVNFFQHFGP